MASIFTFDPDPPQLTSPWLVTEQSRELEDAAISFSAGVDSHDESLLMVNDKLSAMRLEAEPQQGPTEYKLHLLLRPRQQIISSTTGKRVTGSQHSKPQSSTPISAASPSIPSTPILQYSGSRQHRLEQLTTQLLWRLQQSSPYHSTAADSIILPSLPEATPQLQAPQQVAKLLPGLEESKGALYEIGVADDGALIGLIEDEMNESLNNLRAMAASLGCDVKILRMVDVGECEYFEQKDSAAGPLSIGPSKLTKKGRLYVAEAYVKPIFNGREMAGTAMQPLQHDNSDGIDHAAVVEEQAATVSSKKEQLRVSFTGATTSGKSSLLGTLSTSTLDNGRGKSRLSLLKHRHEIASGMTSSVAQELVGYNDKTSIDGTKEIQVVNYATGNVSSWDDIHASSISGRLAFLCDSAGHPRFRRTTVRGLVGWAPHWTLMCIAADTSSETKVQDSPLSHAADDAGAPASVANIAMAHLNLCLKLKLPLIVVITKFDAATKDLLRKNLSDVLTQLKAAGRKPIMIKNSLPNITEEDLKVMRHEEQQEISEICDLLSLDPVTQVPILFTSAVKGIGVSKLHALLRYLPIIRPAQASAESGSASVQEKGSSCVYFHIDDTFNLRSKFSSSAPDIASNNKGLIVSGHLSQGKIRIGDDLLLGPFSWPSSSEEDGDQNRRPITQQNPNEPFLSPRSFGEALHRRTLSSRPQSSVETEWIKMRVISLRNLRLPVRELLADQAGTIGIVPSADDSATPALDTSDMTIRKGMVLTNGDIRPEASHAFTAAFGIAEASSVFVGSIVIVYSATVRAAAKIIAVQLQDNDDYLSHKNGAAGSNSATDEDEDDGFRFNLDEDTHPSSTIHHNEERLSTRAASGILVTFHLLSCREWIGVGSKVLVMPGGSGTAGQQGLVGTIGGGLRQWDRARTSVVAGLDGYVGVVVERFG